MCRADVHETGAQGDGSFLLVMGVHRSPVDQLVVATAAGILWMYILKHWSFSQAYPLSSLAYVFGMIAAMLVFHEHIAWTQWVGILFIMAGCYLVVN